MTIFNSGSAPATLGNIVVNLQKRVGRQWMTVSSDIADATNGDAATTANIQAKASSEGLSYFTENSASGALMFMDASSNTPFSLMPQVQVPAGQGLSLLFQASFNNNVLNIPTGAAVRAEVILSFGNAAANPSSTANVDINGNGMIDSDEMHVRSVPARLSAMVPGPFNGNNVTITDTLDDIKASGTATFDNVSINLDTTMGTVTATVDGGASGGSVTNCARLTSGGMPVPTLNQNMCSTIQVRPSSCTPGAAGCGWQAGDMHTWTQLDWGDSPLSNPAAALVATQFLVPYPFGTLEVGITGTAGFSMTFTSSGVLAYLPAPGPPDALTSDLFNPTSSSSGAFGGHVVALELNVDFSSVGLLAGVTTFGSLNICGVPGLSNMTVQAFLTLANNNLGGAGTFSIATLYEIATELNASFFNGSPLTFAQEHLFNGPCPRWQPGDMLTYPQGDWGDSPATNPAAALLQLRWDQVYASSAGLLEVGIPGAGGFSLSLTDSVSALAYLPAVGPIGALTNDLVNPTSSSSGSFGGDVVTLELNTDFSTAGFLNGVTTLGSLNLCGVAGLPNMTVAEFLGIANTVLGGGSGPTLATVASVATQINASFVDGSPSTFAQEHLFNGPCP